MSNADWTGNKNSIFKTLGASNHTDKERETNDYYATSRDAIDALVKAGVKFPNPIWECSAGECHLSNPLKEYGYTVYSTDLIQRGIPLDDTLDFLATTEMYKDSQCILSNPPYKTALSFIEHGLDILHNGQEIWMFLKIQFLEGKARRKLFDTKQLKCVYISSSRILCAKNADFDGMRAGGGSAVAYAWFVWEKGYNGDAVIKWIN
ncbi:MAG: NAD(P)-dependent oxidoreductase [Lachnospiraceae bacterium]|nr:NAD(P)-dependent oxidoreductase [Ruminococcus sp.]MCM1276993.1 NAD(P)-dependent oxidoreductase [Lachnospiraceae bacterium]